MSARLRRLVVRRARNRCEYCCLSQSGQEATFHVDHVVPVIAGGHASGDNLALTCVSIFGTAFSAQSQYLEHLPQLILIELAHNLVSSQTKQHFSSP